MPTREQLQARIDHLESRLSAGVRAIQDQNGERLEYQSGREMTAALAAARRQLAAMDRLPVHTIRFNMTKGL